MNSLLRFIFYILAGVVASANVAQASSPKREMRGVWLATVWGLSLIHI